MSMICSFCKMKYPADYKWCMEDGNALESDTGQYEGDAAPGGGFEGAAAGVCPDCGTPFTTGDTFCGGCGGSLTGKPAPAIAAAPAGGGKTCSSCGTPLTPGDVFCGGCGQPSAPSAAAPAFQAPPVAPPPAAPAMAAPSPAPAAGPAQPTCPSCGMEIVPDDVFCGTCGHPLNEAPAAAPPLPSPAPVTAMPEPAAAPVSAPALSAGNCPSCGMDLAPGDTFCGTCGHPLSSLAPPPMTAKVSAPTCPNCGMEVDAGAAACGTCGSTLGGAMESAPPTARALDISSITDGIPVCPTCGIENEPGASACSACGATLGNGESHEPSHSFDLGTPAPEVATAAPPPAAPKPAPAAGGAEIVCSCCGTASAAGSAFCGNCGVDFD